MYCKNVSEKLCKQKFEGGEGTDMEKTMTVNQTEYGITRLLGHGKGGYSYLAYPLDGGGNKDRGSLCVLKQIHHEPCEYYTFGDKIAAEQNDYRRLLKTGIRMPQMVDIDVTNERIVKEYIEGPTLSELIEKKQPIEAYIGQVRQMAEQVRVHGLNIDYYPTNFVVKDGLVYYIDYECNPYSEEWSFENWGITCYS